MVPPLKKKISRAHMPNIWPKKKLKLFRGRGELSRESHRIVSGSKASYSDDDRVLSFNNHYSHFAQQPHAPNLFLNLKSNEGGPIRFLRSLQKGDRIKFLFSPMKIDILGTHSVFSGENARPNYSLTNLQAFLIRSIK